MGYVVEACDEEVQDKAEREHQSSLMCDDILEPSHCHEWIIKISIVYHSFTHLIFFPSRVEKNQQFLTTWTPRLKVYPTHSRELPSSALILLPTFRYK